MISVAGGQYAGECAVQRNQKNAEMDEAIQRIPALVEKLNALLNRISGISSPEVAKTSGPPRGVPSLREMLNEGPDYIRDYVGKAMAITEEIESVLF